VSTKRVLLADDSALARRAVRSLLKGDTGFEVVGEAEDGAEALALTRELAPELVLMDIDMPRCDGLLATRMIKRESPHVTVVILTVSDDAEDLFEAIGSGAQGYLPKNLDPGDWLGYLQDLIGGDAPPRGLAHRVLAEIAPPTASPVPEDTDPLTRREQEVACLIADALTNRQVAATLRISEQTVKNHVKSILKKMRLNNRVELALYARRLASGRTK
jgi:DNA-binding NarL/FixJ family response regulator